MPAPPVPPFQRLDKWLWCARILRGRDDCARLVETGGLRLNRQPTDKPHAKLRVGDVITLHLRDEVRVLEVLALAERRGPPAAAQALYRLIPPPGARQAESGARNAALHTLPCGLGETTAYRDD
jgi:ribosome-associated heat shock protein Hsp15